jgi:hypothetical protein
MSHELNFAIRIRGAQLEVRGSPRFCAWAAHQLADLLRAEGYERMHYHEILAEEARSRGHHRAAQVLKQATRRLLAARKQI